MCDHGQALHQFPFDSKTICVPGVEVCTGSKLKPEPGPYLRSYRRPPPPTNSQLKKRKKAAFHDCMQRNRLIKTLPFHKHLPVMTVCEHQVQRSHTFCRVYEFCMDKTIILPPCKLWSFFCQLRLVSILSTLNQT